MKRSIFIVTMLVLLCLYGCGMTRYDDYTMSKTQTSKADSDTEKIIDFNVEWQTYPSDVVFVDEYNSKTVLRTMNNNMDIVVKDSQMAKDMSVYEQMGGTDENLLSWIKEVDSRSGFNCDYDSDNKKFMSDFSGINMNIYMVSLQLINNSSDDIDANIDDLKLFLVDKENGRCRRLAYYESSFHDYAISVGPDRGRIVVKAGENKDVVMFFLEPDKDIIKTKKTSEGTIVLESDEYNTDNLYMRLSVAGKHEICNEEYFVKIKKIFFGGISCEEIGEDGIIQGFSWEGVCRFYDNWFTVSFRTFYIQGIT